MNRYFFVSLTAAVLTLSGCVSNKVVQTVQTGDDSKQCPELKAELSQLGTKFDDAKEDSGVTGKNVGLAIIFWPGIIFNEVRASKNQDSIDKRLGHLTTLYNSKCSSPSPNGSVTSSKLSDKLSELKGLHEKKLIDDAEYEKLRKRAIEQAQ